MSVAEFVALLPVLAGLGGMVWLSSPVYVAICFGGILLVIAGWLAINGAEFIGIGLVIIYAGAVVVTFLFLIMLANQTGQAEYERAPNRPVLAWAAGILLFLMMLFSTVWREGVPGLVNRSQMQAQTGIEKITSDRRHVDQQNRAPFSRTARLSVELFSRFFWLIQGSALLLTIVMMNCVVIARLQKDRRGDTNDYSSD
ncbi:MAG: hypothetical protein C4297_09720 [Gemmataceae bacterium]